MLLPDPLPDHPRLLAKPGDWPRLRQQIATDAVSARLYATLLRRATAILTEPVLTRLMTGKLLLMVSRQALERLSVLALVACVTDDTRFAERAEAEMRAIAAFPDWNPAHFLDTAELALAMSIGYDWLYDQLDGDTRHAVETALLDKAIAPSLDATAPSNWWLSAAENWVQVCHGGLSAAAIVLADCQPKLAEQILQRALDSLPPIAAAYAPDGAYPEGPMYWSYGTAYHVTLAAALERLTGSTAGIDAYPGFAESAHYIRQVTAPSGDYFNYADCAARRRLQAQLFWLSSHFGRPEWLDHDLADLDAGLAEYEAEPGVQYWYYDMVALALLWHRPQPAPTADTVGDLGFWHGRGAMPVALYRWGRDEFYLCIKGGSVGLSHSHMDLGSFVFEAGGVRWAVDLGMQDYESLESAKIDIWNEIDQSSPRWDVFRIGPESHNILRFDGRPQLLHRKAEIVEATATVCTVDLSSVYGDEMQSVRRTFTTLENGVRIRDQWSSKRPVTADWQLLTFAASSVGSEGFLLNKAGKRLKIEVRGSQPFRTSKRDMGERQRPFDLPNPSLSRLEIQSIGAPVGWFEVDMRLVA